MMIDELHYILKESVQTVTLEVQTDKIAGVVTVCHQELFQIEYHVPMLLFCIYLFNNSLNNFNRLPHKYEELNILQATFFEVFNQNLNLLVQIVLLQYNFIFCSQFQQNISPKYIAFFQLQICCTCKKSSPVSPRFIYNYRFYFQSMLIPEEVYRWLLKSQIIPNEGEIDDRDLVSLPTAISTNFDNGYLIGEIIRKMAIDTGKKVPTALTNVKRDNSKNARLTNWNFIWLAIDTVGLKLDNRIKELILQGEQALVVEVIRQLHERDPNKQASYEVKIKTKATGKPTAGRTQAVDVKKINLAKDPQDSETSLQFLILLLKSSLGMNLEEILGLFTNQNKYLAHIIVKGINDNFDPVILFYSLLNKYAHKLKQFYEKDNHDAEACLYALKPGFISKNQKVAQLSIELFGHLGNIYSWLVSDDSKNTGTMLLGLKRHTELRELYWILLLQLIQGEEVQFFTKYYPISFQNQTELVEITCYLVKYISQSFLGQKLTHIGVISSWLDIAIALPEDNIQAQTVCFKLIGQLMLYLPDVIDQNEESLLILSRNWESRTLPQFSMLLNELIGILQKLGQGRSALARRTYLIIANVAKVVGAGDKRDYLIQNFLPLIAKFPTIPSEYMIQNLKRHPLSGSEFLLVCESIQINQNIQTLVTVGNFLKNMFLENPLLNFYVLTLVKQITQKSLNDSETGSQFLLTLLTESLQLYGNILIKYKPRPKQQQSMYFGRKGNPEKINKQQQDEFIIKDKWKQLLLQLIISLTDFAFAQNGEELREIIKEKILNANSTIRLNNHKIGSKQLEDLLSRRFGISKEEQIQHSEQFSKKMSSTLQQSMIRRSKAISNAASVSLKLKGPQNMIKQFQLVAQRRKQQQQQKKAQQLKKQFLEQKKKQNVRKQLEITNLLRGQIGQAQLREEGFLQKLMHESKDLELVYMEQLESRDVEAVETILKKHHKVLRYLFLNYTGTMYSSHTNQKFEDNTARKEILTAVQLGKILKQYRLAFLTNQPELCNLVRDINVKIIGRREVNELDYVGFEQFIIQFCTLIFTRHHNNPAYMEQSQRINSKQLKQQPIYVILKQFFLYLKNIFKTLGDKVSLFEDINDIPMSQEQAYEIDIFNKKLLIQPDYILPKGYKKIVQKTVQFQYKFRPQNINLPEQYEVAIQALDYIFFKSPLNMHIIENVSEKITVYKVKPTALGSLEGDAPKERAMSTLIQRKAPILMDIIRKRGSSKGMITALKELPPKSKGIGIQAAGILEQIVDKIETSQQKEKAKHKKIISIAKLQQIQKAKIQMHAKKVREKEEAKQLLLKKEREEQRKRREQTEKYLQEQRQKLSQKRKKEQEQRSLKQQQQQSKQSLKKQNKQKFKAFHQGQLDRIKKIGEQASEKIKKSKDEEEQQKYHHDELRKKLRQKIQQDDKKIIEPKKEVEGKITKLYESQPIKKVLQRYNPNFKAIFYFLLQHTYLSLTEKKHNNEVIYDTWRMFLNAFQLSPLIMQGKDIAYIFKFMTRDKLTPKEYHIGLSFDQFQEALFRISIKYNTFFNLIADKIKDKIDEPVSKNTNLENDKKDNKKSTNKMGKNTGEASKQQKNKLEPTKVVKGSKQPEKQQNQFDEMSELNIKDLIKQNNSGKEYINEYGDISKVTEKTLLGLIYYLKVPSDKIGQQKRFREVMGEKSKATILNSDKLKQKLNEEYSLENNKKKTVEVEKNEKARQGSVSLKSIK